MRFIFDEIGNDVYFALLNQENNDKEYWKDEICTLFVLSGSADIFVNGEYLYITDEDIIVLDRYTAYDLKISDNSLVLAMYIKVSLLRSHLDLLNNRKIHCCSAMNHLRECDQKHLDAVRGYMARIFYSFYKKEHRNTLYIYKESLAYLRYLHDHFSSDHSQEDSSQEEKARLKRILEYIEHNYMQPITLEQMASTEFLSTGHFSRLFRKYTGIPFTQYLKTVRLGRAHTALLQTNESVTNISLNHGFASANAFIAAFREVFGDTPREYRKQMVSKQAEQIIKSKKNPVSDAFKPLTKYMEAGQENPFSDKATESVYFNEFEIDLSNRTGTLNRSWEDILTMGWAKELLLAPVQNQVRCCQRDIGFKYIRFHGLLDDKMMVYREVDGKAVHNFTYIDMLFDFLRSVRLLPYVEFSYMPAALAKENNVTYEHGSVISPPKDRQKWIDLIESLLDHWISWYGKDEVSNWRFTNLPGYYAYQGYFEMEEYVGWYEDTYRTIKRILPEAQVGGPGCDISTLQMSGCRDWDIFFDYCIEKSCLPDFITFQCFHSEYLESSKAAPQAQLTQGKPFSQISDNENYLQDKISSLKCWLKKKGVKYIPLVLDTWNSTWWQRDLCNDTCYKSAFLVKNILQNCNQLQGMAYWTMSDFMEELPMEKEMFHGGYGLITYCGIPKSGYHALRLLSQIGSEIVAMGDGYCVTVNKGKIVIIAYSYCHYDRLYQQQYVANDNEADRYQVFLAKEDMNMRFILSNLEEGLYEIETLSIDRNWGSCFDSWLRMGAPMYLKREQGKFLKDTSRPSYTVSQQQTEDREICLEATLTPHQVILITMNKR